MRTISYINKCNDNGNENFINDYYTFLDFSNYNGTTDHGCIVVDPIVVQMNVARDTHSNVAIPAISNFVLAYSYYYSYDNNQGFLNNTQNPYYPGANEIVSVFNAGTNGSIHQNKTISFSASLPNSFAVTGVTDNNPYYTFDGVRFSINGNELGVTEVPTLASNFKTLSVTPFVHHVAYSFAVSNAGSEPLSFAYSYNGASGNSTTSSVNTFVVPADSAVIIQPIVQNGYSLSYFYRNNPTTIYTYVQNQSIVIQQLTESLSLKVDYNQVNAQTSNQVFVSYKNASNSGNPNLQFSYRFPIDGGGYDGQSNVQLFDDTIIYVNDSQSVQFYDILYSEYGHSEYVLSYDIFIPSNSTNLSGIYDNSLPIDINQNCFNNGIATISFTLTPQSNNPSFYAIKQIVLTNNNPYSLKITLQMELAEIENVQQNISQVVNIYKDAQLSNQLLYDEDIMIDANSNASYWFSFNTLNEYYDLTLTGLEHSTTDEIDESIISDFAVEIESDINITVLSQSIPGERKTFVLRISSNDIQTITADSINIDINTVFDHASHTKKLLHFYVPRSPDDNSILCKTNGIDPISYIRYSILDRNDDHSNVVKRLVADKYDVVTSLNNQFNDNCVLRLSYYDVFQNSNEYDNSYILSYWKICAAHTTDLTPDLEDVRLCMTFPISENSNYSDLEIDVKSINDRIDSVDILDVYSYVKPLGSRIDYNFALNNIDSDVYMHIRDQIAEMPIKIYDLSDDIEYKIDDALYRALYSGSINARISTNTSLQKTTSENGMWLGKPILLDESHNLIVSFPSFNQEGLGLSTQIIRDIHIDSEHYDVVEVSLDNLDNIVVNNDQNTLIRNDIASGNKVYKFSPINATSSDLLEHEPDTIVSFDDLLSIQHSININDTYYALIKIFYSIDEVYTNMSNSSDNRFVVNSIKSNNIYSTNSNIAFNISQMFDKGYVLASVHACEIDNGNYNESSGLSYTYLSSPFKFNVANCSQNAHLCLFMEFSYANGISKFIDENPKNNIPDTIETNNSYVEPEYKVYVQFGNSNELELSWKPKVEI